MESEVKKNWRINLMTSYKFKHYFGKFSLLKEKVSMDPNYPHHCQSISTRIKCRKQNDN